MIVHYLLPIVFSLFMVILLVWFKKRLIFEIGFSWWIYITGFVGIYSVIVWLAFCSDLILNMRLQEFDLNKDGIFTGAEITQDQKELMSEVANDTARKLSIYFGLFYSFIITGVLFLLDIIRSQVWIKFIKKTNG